MVNPHQIPEVLDVFEKWVPDRGTRSALLSDLHETQAWARNKSFRDTVNALIAEHARRHLRPTTPNP